MNPDWSTDPGSAAQPGASAEARETALWRWWVPYAARDVWMGRATRDAALRVILNVARGTCPQREWRPIDIDQAIDCALASLNSRHLTASCEITRAIDPMFDARRSPAEIQAAVDRLAAEHGFPDVCWDDLIRDRVAAWKWRQRNQRRTA